MITNLIAAAILATNVYSAALTVGQSASEAVIVMADGGDDDPLLTIPYTDSGYADISNAVIFDTAWATAAMARGGAVTVQVATNTVPADNSAPASQWPTWIDGGLVHGTWTEGGDGDYLTWSPTNSTTYYGYGEATPATEKTETTTITEIRTLTFEWEGETFTCTHERVLSRTVKRWKKRETWEIDDQ